MCERKPSPSIKIDVELPPSGGATRGTVFIPINAQGTPTELGSGRSAQVFLAQRTPPAPELDSSQTEFVAIKCLLDDENEQYARSLELRFDCEKDGAKHFSVHANTFIRYLGEGTLSQKSGQKELMKNYGLRGPFYVMDLAYCTLNDLLDTSVSWPTLPAYQALPHAQEALKKSQDYYADDIKSFASNFLDLDPINTSPSGYEILRAFKTTREAELVRTNAVLQVVLEIVYLIKQLHAETDIKPRLCHRDIKPGNILLTHAINPGGIDSFRLRLSDLGGVANEGQLRGGEATFRVDGWRTPGATAPGSEFYRAPEQAAHPREVRLSIQGTRAVVKGSKLPEIGVGDWIAVVGGQHDGSGASAERYQRVTEVERCNGVYHIVLANKLPVTGDDVVGFVIKGTGFHTDGYSVGAILYDLLTGGRNPEQFYTYCIRMYDRWSNQSIESVDALVEVLLGKRWLPKFQISELLTDTRGKVLPRIILTDIVRCMTRDISSSYYQVTADGFLGEANGDAMANLERSLLAAMSAEHYPCPASVPPSLRDDLLLKLRCFWPCPQTVSLRAMQTEDSG